MNAETLQELGLTPSQAKTYMTLITKGQLSPPDLAKLTGETRTNTYMILAKLEELELVSKSKTGNKITYQPNNPLALERLSYQKRVDLTKTDNKIRASMPALLSYYYTFSEKPGIKQLEGEESIKDIYRDTLRTKEEIYFVRSGSSKELSTLGEKFFEDYKKKRSDLKIHTHAFTQDTEESRKHSAKDAQNLMTRVWLDPQSYTAPVEIDVYGDKTAFLSFGEDVMGVVIQSPTIANAMKEILDIIKQKSQA